VKRDLATHRSGAGPLRQREKLRGSTLPLARPIDPAPDLFTVIERHKHYDQSPGESQNSPVGRHRTAAVRRPAWPDGIYTLLRLAVTLVAIYGIFALGTGKPWQKMGLAVVALLFNPFVTVRLPRLLWAPIDLGVAYWFWTIIDRQLSPKSEDPKLPQQR